MRSCTVVVVLKRCFLRVQQTSHRRDPDMWSNDDMTDILHVAYGNIEGYNVHAYIPTWIV
jgi:hypothetical protein